MIGRIYKITNIANGHCYIGKTNKTLDERFNDHINEINTRTHERRPLYCAMRKHGIENFKIDLLEELNDVTNELLNKRETYWIAYYNTYKREGYNATTGGDGFTRVDYSRVVELYNKGLNQKEISQELKCSIRTVYRALEANNIYIEHKAIPNSRAIIQLDKNTNEELREFNTYADAKSWLIENNFTKAKNLTHLYECIRGNKPSAYGFRWKWKHT